MSDISSHTYDVLVVGSGISGLTAAASLRSKGLSTLVLEKDNEPGGLIRCQEVEGNLHHLVGGHVFNTKIASVKDFFWQLFDESLFTSATRHAAIRLSQSLIPYPIENNLRFLPEEVAKACIQELLSLQKNSCQDISSFGDFLLSRFGRRLCELYFLPYNRKIWQHDPFEMALEWLDGKLPMPSVEQIMQSNILHNAETEMVHSSFFYPRAGGSQYIVNRLLNGALILTGTVVDSIRIEHDGLLLVNGLYRAKAMVYTGDVRRLPSAIHAPIFEPALRSHIELLMSHGTSNILCARRPTPYSWEYLPEPSLISHRIINTGNFSKSNTSGDLLGRGLTTCVLEASGCINESDMKEDALRSYGITDVLNYSYRDATYVIQEASTREIIKQSKRLLEPVKIFLSGRFAEWEYYNMDTAIHAALQLSERVSRQLASM